MIFLFFLVIVCVIFVYLLNQYNLKLGYEKKIRGRDKMVENQIREDILFINMIVYNKEIVVRLKKVNLNVNGKNYIEGIFM